MKERFYDTISSEDIARLTPVAEQITLELYQRMTEMKFRGQRTSRMASEMMQKKRKSILGELFNKFVSKDVRDQDYLDTCRKLSSIMSVESWKARKLKMAAKANAVSLLPRVLKHRETVAQRRERFRMESMRFALKVQRQSSFTLFDSAPMQSVISPKLKPEAPAVNGEPRTEVQPMFDEIIETADRAQEEIVGSGQFRSRSTFKTRYPKRTP